MTIYEYLKDKTPREIEENAYRLPDVDIEKGEVWVPGAYEGTILRSNMRIKYQSAVNFLTARKVKKQALKPSERNRQKLLKRLEKYAAISVVDPICSFCEAFKLTKNDEKKAALRELAIDLIKNVNKREIVKIGIALLGICGSKSDLDIIKPLGLHDEFTLYVAGTASMLLKGEEKNRYLLELLKGVKGWGKIAILFELDYTYDDVRLEIVKNGCKNDISLSYSSNICAIKGKMIEVLRKISSDGFQKEEEMEIFTGVCDIFTGLLSAKENQDGLSEYPHAREAAKLFNEICDKKPYLAELDSRTSKILDGIKYII